MNALVVQPVSRASIAYQTSQVVVIGSHAYRFPQLTDDPQASWTPEASEIVVDDAAVNELEVTPLKVAGLSVLSRELGTDSLNPGASEIIGQAISRDIARQVDIAFFGTTTLNGPNGLGGLVGISTVPSGPVTNLDSFAAAQAIAEDHGATISSWVTSPAMGLQLAQLKTDDTTSNASLLQSDPTLPTRRQVGGVPLFVSPAVPANTIYGIPVEFSYVVQSQDATLDVDASVFFTSDRLAVRATLRVAFGWPHPKAVVRIEVTA